LREDVAFSLRRDAHDFAAGLGPDGRVAVIGKEWGIG